MNAHTSNSIQNHTHGRRFSTGKWMLVFLCLVAVFFSAAVTPAQAASASVKVYVKGTDITFVDLDCIDDVGNPTFSKQKKTDIDGDYFEFGVDDLFQWQLKVVSSTFDPFSHWENVSTPGLITLTNQPTTNRFSVGAKETFNVYFAPPPPSVMVDVLVKKGAGYNKVVLTWSSGSAECTGDCRGGSGVSVPEGEDLIVHAIADSGSKYRFKEWSSNSDSPAHPENQYNYKFVVKNLTSAKYFEADFDQISEGPRLTIEATSNPSGGGGTVVAGPGSKDGMGGGEVRVPDSLELRYQEYDQVEVSAIPDSDSYFVGWSSSWTSGPSGSTTPVTVSLGEESDRSVRGTFAPKYLVSLQNTIVSAAEGSDLVFPLTLDRLLEDTITVQYEISAGPTNSAGTGDLTFGSGQTVTISPTDPLEIRVSTTNDTVVELDETFTLTLTSVSSGKVLVGSPATATGTITDNDNFTLSLSGDSQLEGTDVIFTVELGADLELDSQVAVGYSVSDGTATTADNDFTGTSGTVYFNADASAGSKQTFTVSTAVDGKVESDETIVGEVSTGHSRLTTTGSTLTADGTILNDDSATVSISGDADATEGGATGTFTLTMSATSDSDTTVTFGLDAASVAGSSDYNLDDGGGTVTTSVVIPAGSSTATLTVTANDDSVVEGTEALVLKLVGTDNASILTDTNTASIDLFDNDRFTLTVTGDSQPEGTALTFTVTLGGDLELSAPVSVTYNVNDGTATLADNDYSDTTGTVSFAADASSGSTEIFTVSTTVDSKVESDETVVGQVSTTHGSFTATGSTLTADGIIENNDSATVSISGDADATEGGATGTFTLTMSATSDTDTTVTFGLDAASVADSSDYSLDDGGGSVTTSVVIPAGASSATLTVTAADDSVVEGTEALVLKLVGTDNASILTDTTTASIDIFDNDTATVSIAATDASAAEPSDNGQFTVTLTKASSTDTVVSYSVRNAAGDATPGSDYTTLSGSVTVASGMTTAPIDVLVLEDVIVEGDEPVVVTLDGTDNTRITVDTATAGADTATVTIADSVDTASVSIAATDAAAAETLAADPANPGQFTISLSAVSSTDTTVTWVISGTADTGDGHLEVGGSTVTNSATIPAGDTSVSVDLIVTDDGSVEADETMTLTLDSVSSGDSEISIDGIANSATATIADNDSALLSISASDATADESGGTGEYTLSLTAPSSTDTTVSLTLAGSTALTTDFSLAANATVITNSVTIPAGDTTVAIVLTAVDDNIVEASEAVQLNLGSITFGDVDIAVDTANNSAVVTIDDNDTATVRLVATDPSAAEPSDGGQFTVTLSNPSGSATTVNYLVAGTATPGDIATAGSDYEVLPGSVSFAAGETVQSIDLTVIDDTRVEATETVIVTLDSLSGDPQITIHTTDNEDTVSIGDDDSYLVYFEAADQSQSIPEGDGDHDVAFTVSLNAAGDLPVTVSVSAAGLNDGTHVPAVPGSDFTLNAASVTIPAGDTSAPIPVTIKGDVVVEEDDSFVITLDSVSSGPGAVDTANAEAVGTIVDDDAYTLSIDSVEVNPEGDSGTTTASFTVSVDLIGAQSVEVAYTVADGSATNGADYDMADGTVTIPANTASAPIAFTVNGDTDIEGNEDFTVTLGAVVAGPGAAASDGSEIGTATIKDDDGYRIVVSDAGSVSEGDTAFFTVYLDPAPTGTHTVSIDYTTVDGTALAGTDYTAKSGTLNFNSTNPSRTVDVATIENTSDDGDRSFKLVVDDTTMTGSFAGIAYVGDSEGTCTIVDDEYVVTFLVSSAGNGSISGTTPQVVSHGGSTSAVEAVPIDDEYHFYEWTGDYTGDYQKNPLVISNVTSDMTVYAHFRGKPVLIPKTLPFSAEDSAPHGEILPSTPQVVDFMSDFTFDIQPESGYCVDYVRVDAVNLGYHKDYTFTSVTKDHTIEAHFRDGYQVRGAVAPETARGNNATWSVTGTHLDGTAYSAGPLPHFEPLSIPCDVLQITVTFSAITGWETPAPQTISLTGDTIVTGHYKPQLVITSLNGKVTSSDTQIDCGLGGTACTAFYPYGTKVLLESLPDTSYVFSHWSGSIAGAAPTTSFYVKEPMSVTANYAAQTGTNVDHDGDGWTEDDGDCAPYDGTIYPGAPEVCSGTGNNVDHDCDGLTAVSIPSDPECDDTVVGISNLPLDTLLQAAPANIMVVVDDSISMDWEFSCAEGEEGKYEGDYWYFMPDPERDNESNHNDLPTGKRADWRIQWHDYNRMYYDPKVEYRPWPSTTGDGTRLPQADLDCPKSDPMVEDTDYCLDMDSDFFSLGDNTTDDNVYTSGIVVDSHDANGGSFTLQWKDNAGDSWITEPLSGPWPFRNDTNHNEGYNNNFYDTDANGNLEWDYIQITWEPPSTVLSSQYYNVYAWWRDIGEYSQNTKYYIYHEGGKAGPFEMNQENNSRTWNRLGDRAYRGITKVTIEDYIEGESDHVCADAVSFVPAADPTAATLSTVPVAHYYAVVPKDDNGDGQPDLDGLGLPAPGRVILVVIDGVDQRVEYWETTFDSDNYVTGFTALDPADPAQVPDSIKPPRRKFIYTYASATGTPTELEQYEAERQNFANWYSYYRRRELTAKAAIGELFDDLRGVRAGVHYLNNTNRSLNVRPVRVTEIDGDTGKEIIKNDIETLLDNLYHYQSSGGTRLRETVLEVGEYFDQTDGKQPHEDLRTKNWDEYGLENPWATADEGGECQQSFMIITTDGYYNKNVKDINNVDGQTPLEDFRLSTPDKNSRQLFADSYENTLSDFTMMFYQKDLSNTLANKVPVNDANHDYATHQHLVSYTVALGLRGYMDPEDYVLYSEEPNLLNYPVWQDPFGDGTYSPRKIDDLWHAAVNGRGMYLSAEDPARLTESLTEIMQNLVARIGSGSSLSINGEELNTGLVMYQASYSTDGWWGDVRAYPVSVLDGMVDNDVYLWSAGEALGAGADWDIVNWDTDREIATYKPGDASVNPAGIPFRWSSLTTGQQALLSDDPTTGAVEDDGLGETRLKYLRGSNANELRQGGSFRDRYSKLGDIVHSAPFYVDYVRNLDTNGDGIDETVPSGAVFVSANDGMLHAFDTEDGGELFAYVPNLVFDHLNMFSVAEPYFRHMYYVDMTPYIKEVGGNSGSEKLLVGGLGKGGKGYFCLDVTNPWTNTEGNAADWVLWEYPHWDSSAAEKDNMGYTFSEAFIVQSYWTDSGDATNHWITVFGNGYASDSGTAALYVLNAKTGELLKMIDTGAVGNNGLSTPTPVDINGDYTVDFVYAGDLQGNVWKFDLRDSDPANWRSAYYLDNATPTYYDDDTPQPLFRARGREKDSLGNYTIPSVLYGQPITTKINVIRHCGLDTDGYMVLFGTGRYLSTLDVSDTSYQTMYGIWDYGDEPDEFLGSFSRGATVELSNQDSTVSLLQQEVIQWGEYGGKWLRVLSNYEPDWTLSGDDPANHAGWYIDLPLEKERVIRNSTVRDGKLIFLSSIPSDDPCDAGGDSIVHEINACTGGRLENAQFDLNNDGVIDENDLIPLLDGSGNPMTDASGNPIMVPPSGVKFDTMMYPPIILLTPGGITERKYFSTAAGSIQTIEETAERRGVYYWRMR